MLIAPDDSHMHTTAPWPAPFTQAHWPPIAMCPACIPLMISYTMQVVVTHFEELPVN